MKRFIQFFILVIFAMLGMINSAFATTVATSFQFPLNNYPINDGCRQWEWHGDFDGDGDNEYHLADDACVPEGTVVYAVANGTVKYAGSYTACPDWGYLVVIEHSMPDGSKVTSVYGHVIPDSVTAGSNVVKGQYIGSIMSHCVADHIHFGIYDGPFSEIACYGPGNCLTAGYGASTGNYLDPVDFIQSHQETCTTTSTTSTIHLMTVEPQSNGDHTINGFRASGSGNSTTLSTYGWQYTNTGTVRTNNTGNGALTWLVGNVNGDVWDDVVQIRIKNNKTYTQVYLASGTDGLNAQTKWKSTPGEATEAFLADMNNDSKADLILGFPNSDSTMTWKYFTSSGSTFNTAVTWSTSFGKESDIFVIGDFNGNGKAELLRGREDDGSTGSNFSNPLIWKRLDTAGNDSTVLSSFGYSGDAWIAADVDDDDHEELVRIDEADNDVTVYVAEYDTSEQEFIIITSYANDVGGTDGEYFLFPLDYTDGYADLIRFNGDDLFLLQSSGGTDFEEQGSQSTLVSGISDEAIFLFGTFGQTTTTSETCVSAYSLNGDDVDPDDEEVDDLDADGYTTDEGDCNDLSNGVHPNHPEDVDSVDNNCNGLIDEAVYPSLLAYVPTTGSLYSLVSDGTQFTTPRTLWTGNWYYESPYASWYQPMLCDVDGDLFSEWVTYTPNGTVYVNQSGTDTWSGSTETWLTGAREDAEPFCADFDGDGLDDLLLYHYSGFFDFAFSTGTSFTTPENWCACGDQSAPNASFQLLLGDVNGDTLTDIIWKAVDGSNWYVGINTDPGLTWELWYSNFGGTDGVPIISDVNQDSLSDILIMHSTSNEWRVVYSTGDSFNDQVVWLSDEDIISTDEAFLIDLTNDGYPDAIRYDPTTGSWYVGINTGSSFQDMSLWATSFGGDPNLVFLGSLHR